MIMLLTCSNSPDKLSENDELREFELSGSDCMLFHFGGTLEHVIYDHPLVQLIMACGIKHVNLYKMTVWSSISDHQ